MSWRAIGTGSFIAAAVVSGVLSLPQVDVFVHDEHQGLFPTCLGCHEGIASGDAEAIYTITSEECAACHDGTELEEVDWAGPSRAATNLVYSHPGHASEVETYGDEPIECSGCHQLAEATNRMQVVSANPESCIDCHAHQAEEHLAPANDCSSCHMTLARASGIPTAKVAGFPQPGGHETIDFILSHAESAQSDDVNCAYCHARESCERCHINADDVPSIVALEPDARVAAIAAATPGEWPEPTSHERSDWQLAHGTVALESLETCANCHAAPSCSACHLEKGPVIAAGLPRPDPDQVQGILIDDVRPTTHTLAFATQHGAAASVGLSDCSVCHIEQQCIDCHEGPSSPVFHAVDFVMRHASQAYARPTDCTTCHSTEAFCRDCHTQLGVGAENIQSTNAYHDAPTNWLISHGQAARQGMEACASCHQQTSCLRCHSAKTGWRVNPHGPDFDPKRVADRSTMSCAICHFTLPEAAQ